MRQVEQDGEHIWLRQSVTFTANGQTRTVEMAIPLRPGASGEEIERLLAEAEDAMRRISERLDSHVSELLNGSSASNTISLASNAPGPSSPNVVAEISRPTVSASDPTPAPMSAPTPQPATRPERSTPAAAAGTLAAAASGGASAPATSHSNQPTQPASAPTPSTATTPPARSRPSGPRSAPTPAATSTPAAPAGGELSRKDFIAAAADMGLNVKQVMERLHVRSLEGLDLREALEALHRQLLRGGETPSAASAAAPAASAAPATGKARESAPAAAPRYFEEEDNDEDDITFTVDGEDTLADELGPYTDSGMSASPSGGGGDELEDLDALTDLDLDDVPDFGPPPSAAHASRSASAAPAPARRGASAKSAPTPSTSATVPSAPVEEQAAAPSVSPENQRITQLRAIRGGGTPGTYQRAAYRNVVVNELGDEAAALVRGLWRVNPERLGPEQLDALISWGKQDTFAEEATAVLAALRAERQQATAGAGGSATGTPAAAPEAPSAAAPRPTPRPRSQQPPRASSGGR